jgi:hypothetical protein
MYLALALLQLHCKQRACAGAAQQKSKRAQCWLLAKQS